MPKIFSDLITEEDSITFVTVIAMGASNFGRDLRNVNGMTIEDF